MKKISIIILAALLASACQKEHHTTQLDGTYTGYFNLKTTTAPTTENLPVQLALSGNQFSSGNSGDNYYSVGSGTVSAENSKLDFTNTDAAPDYIQGGSGVVLYNILLTNSYQYTFKGDSLFLVQTASGYTASYKLRKQ